jgi:uncharacterized protein (UPF0276 family)
MTISFPSKPIPASAGIGLRGTHYKEVLNTKPDIAWFEVHSENFFADGGIALHVLEQIRESYPISFHGVGLSLGTSDKLNIIHLQKLKTLIDRFNPALVSEHISWSNIGGMVLNDLLPVPYTKESLGHLVDNIKQTQDFLGRQILVENPSTYLEFSASEMSEPEFINEVIKQSSCGLLLDVNNIYVSAVNHGFNPYDYLHNINRAVVQEIHLAGHAEKTFSGEIKILIDHHGDYVAAPVWDLYAEAINIFGQVPTLIEWDTDIPALSELQNEAKKAQEIIDRKALSNVA